ncbi:helix-turn-helix domain-containing protein [Maledivibacter halophilus]|uniref:AraC family transcriptional regulator, cel operon repressor n=1 Tax=Maledivibacter halophilus TaxID=36842 RepID=A0A1T5M844_9FIRM|nr:helix-turn-helix domain-containing protein [Maledivibacter halophilus]SKC84407.1 AraC family transcriptional regulator, cel operon repressor [Maledivibacter halophilus]
MYYHKQFAEQIINPEAEIYYEMQPSYEHTIFPHFHDFYEFCLIIKGKQLFSLNEKELILKEGSLVFVRPKDIHSKKYIEEGEHITIAFSKKTLDALFNYLGEDFTKDKLLNPENPPFITLLSAERNVIKHQIKKLLLSQIYNKKNIKVQLKIILIHLFSKYFTEIQESDQIQLPSWLEEVLIEMKRKDNFVKGLPAFLHLSGISHEHLCRIIKKSLNITPTGFINEQRLNYAVKLLIYTDMDITSICFESGFGNLSHFYDLFKKNFHTTPAKFRKEKANPDAYL